MILGTYLDKIRFVPEWELEGAVSLAEAESAGPVIALKVVVSRLTQHYDWHQSWH